MRNFGISQTLAYESIFSPKIMSLALTQQISHRMELFHAQPLKASSSLNRLKPSKVGISEGGFFWEEGSI